MIKILITGFVACLWSIQVKSQAAYNGTWTILPEKSQFGGLSADIAAPNTIVVKFSKDSVSTSRTFGQKPAVVENLALNGTKNESYPDDHTFRIAWVGRPEKENKVIFQTHFEVNGKEWEYHRNEIWTLSKDSKELTIERTTILPDKTDKVKAVYINKK